MLVGQAMIIKYILKVDASSCVGSAFTKLLCRINQVLIEFPNLAVPRDLLLSDLK